MQQSQETIGGRYQIIKQLGSGGFSKTYLAADLALPNRPRCVVKKLQPLFNSPGLLENAKERFTTEAITQQRLGNHPQIPQLLAYFEEQGEFYLVQELIEGEELAKEIRNKLLNELEIIQFLQDVLEILNFVHQHKVIHRDIKPSNLIRRKQDNKFVLIDFGVVKEITTLAFNVQTQTLCTQIVGTPGYMPPEQYDGRPTFSSDIYALGMTAIYALTGEMFSPITKTTASETGNSNESYEWREHTQISDKLAFILDKMINPKLSERYQSAAEVLHDLQPLLKLGCNVGGRYLIKSYLGGGVWGYTYLAENPWRPYQSPCVVKRLRQHTSNPLVKREAERRFLTELTVLERLSSHQSKYIPQLWDHFEEDEEFYLVQEFIEGQDLSQELASKKRLREEQVIDILKDVLESLEFIHQQGVIHRDIKPSNLIRRKQDGKIVLIDFGVVKDIVNIPLKTNSGSSSTQPVGTEGYMSPEQRIGRPTFSSDIYALGITAIQALTGKSPEELEKNPQTGEVLWRQESRVSEQLGIILDKMVSLELGKRYQKASEVLKALKRMNKKSSFLNFSQPWVRIAVIIVVVPGLILLVRHLYQQNEAFLMSVHAEALLQVGENRKAIDLYQKSLNINPNDTTAWIQLATAYSQERDFEQMLKACEGAIKTGRNQADAFNCKGSALYELNQLTEAIDAYNQAIRAKSDYFEAWNNLGEVYLRLGQFPTAIKHFQQAIRVDDPSKPKGYLPWYNIGNADYQLGNFKEAIEAYQSAIKLDKNYLPAWIALGNTQKKLMLTSEAMTSYQSAVEINPNYHEAWYALGLLQEELRQYEEAKKSYQKAINLKSNYQPAQDALNRVNLRLNN